MAGFEEQLAKVLNSPEDMAKIAEIAKTLAAGDTHSAGDAQGVFEELRGEDREESVPAENANAGPDMGSVAAGLFGGGFDSVLSGLDISPKIINAMGSAVSGLQSSEKRVELLNAARPFARGDGGDILERAIKAIRLAKAARAALGSMWGDDKFV